MEKSNIQPICASAHPSLPKLSQLRFTIKQLLFAVLVASLCLAAYSLVVRWKQRELIIRTYGSYELYETIRDSQSIEVFQVRLNQEPTNPAIDPDFPKVTLGRCGLVQGKDFVQLRDLLIEPSNFDPYWTKDYLFQPTYMLRCKSAGRDVDIYFDFESMTAAVLIDSQYTYTLQTDAIPPRLREFLSSACGNGTPQ